jgi:histidinol phosphatase-like enzyme
MNARDYLGMDTIAIDFDGVIHNDNKGFNDGTIYGDPIPGSLEAIKSLALKFKIIIFTAKAKSDRPLINGKTGTELVWDWLTKHGINNEILEVTSEKPRAFLYIDDRGYRFSNWGDTIQFIDRNVK